MDRICIPYHSDNGQRERLFNACVERWGEICPGVPIHVGDTNRDPMNRSADRNMAAEGDWTVAIFADGDTTVMDAKQVHRAASEALRTGWLTYAHNIRLALDEAQTERLLGGATLAEVGYEARDPNTFSGVYAVPRPLWDRVQGFDERFQGWGFEDLAFMFACSTIGGGMGRVSGEIVHLWHPRVRAMEEENPNHGANQVLWERYGAARNDVSAMLALVG